MTLSIRNIVLIGYRGTGKTTIGKLLAKKRDMNFISIDSEIEQRLGMPITHIVKAHGWKVFRKTETEILKSLSTLTNTIIDCGGGIIDSKINQDLLKNLGVVVLLTTTKDRIISRLKRKTHRPPLTGHSLEREVDEMLLKRKHAYETTAHLRYHSVASKETACNTLSMLIPRVVLICTGKTIAEMKQDLDTATRTTGFAEIRVDYLCNPTQFEKLFPTPFPVIVTYRSKDEGGLFQGTNHERIQLLEKAVASDASFVDIELKSNHAVQLVKKARNTKIICSYHNFTKTPDLQPLIEKLKATKSHIIKIACMSNSVEDTARMFDAIEKNKLIGISMGKNGIMTRLCGPIVGSPFTYAPLHTPTAPGQVSYEDILTYYSKLW